MAAGAQITVALCSFGEKGMSKLLSCAHPQMPGVNWLVSWQLPEGDVAVPAELASRPDFRVVKTPTRGVSVNRNHALDNCPEQGWVLIGDDDVNYSREGLSRLLQAVRERDDAQVICMKYTSHGEFVKPYGAGEWDLRRPPFGWYVTSFELAFRKEAAASLRFNERLGIGAPRLNSGEETVFLFDLLRSGVKGIFLPIIIGEHPDRTTGERLGKTPEFLFTQGAVLFHIYPLSWPLRHIVHARRSEVPFWRYLKHTYAGAFYAWRSGLYRKNRVCHE